MPTGLTQQILTVFEISLLLIGVWLAGLLAFKPEFRTRWGNNNKLPFWNVTAAEFALYFLALFAGGFVLQSVLRMLLGTYVNSSADREGLEIMIYGTGLDGGALIGWLLFPFLRRALYSDYGVSPPDPPTPAPVQEVALSWNKIMLYAAGTLALSMPVLLALSAGWSFILTKCGLPDEPQDTIAIFANTKSPAVIVGMLLVACGLAPMMEELLFRAGLYRFCRQKLGRGSALLISSVLFGAIHFNWAGFVPLAVLGAMLALIYENTGSIRVAIVAHAFFNLNTILAILSGMTK
ncbi:MAG TPA: CPBP family intramembrane glutamic endopeptidase [Lacunisphaera sp.]